MTTRIGKALSAAELDELVACTLIEANLRTQRERWISLGENFGLARIPTDDGLRLTFTFHPQVEAELQALVAVENDCCAWASWTVERDKDGALAMVARSHADGVATLHTMFTEAEPWRSDS